MGTGHSHHIQRANTPPSDENMSNGLNGITVETVDTYMADHANDLKIEQSVSGHTAGGHWMREIGEIRKDRQRCDPRGFVGLALVTTNHPRK